MRTISNKELNEILEKHKDWLNNKEGGKRADLRDADLSHVNLYGADLHNVILRGADLTDAILRGANLSIADLRCANLQGANLSRADLQCAILRDANLSRVDLRCANLQGANLHDTLLQNVNLQKANLQFANLNGADLSEADLSRANLKYVKRRWFVYAGSIGSRNAETLYFADYDNIRCGCWNNYNGGTLAEFKARINKVYPACNKDELCQQYRLEYLSAIKMFEFMRESYLKSTTEETNNS